MRPFKKFGFWEIVRSSNLRTAKSSDHAANLEKNSRIRARGQPYGLLIIYPQLNHGLMLDNHRNDHYIRSMNNEGTTGMRKPSAIKTKFGYKPVIIRADGSTLRATKCWKTRAEAIASAQLWIEQIELNSKQFQEPRKPVTIKS